MIRRFYHTSHVVCYNLDIHKQGVRLSKMLNPKNKKKWHQNSFDTTPVTKTLAKTSHEPGKRATRRVAVLNKLFMKYTTDLLTTGNLSEDVVGRGIEISKVKVSQNFQLLSIFWVCKGTQSDVETEQILNKVAGPLRHEMSALRLMGEVPYIQFVKDRQEAVIYNLNQRLATADYGEDYTPTDPGHILKTHFSLDTKLSPDMKAKIKQLEDQIPPEEVPIPEMTNCVYGLDHSKIMNRLLAARKKTQDAWSRVDNDNVISFRTTDGKLPSTYDGDQRQELKTYLLKRQIFENKIQKELQSSRKEREIVFEHMNNKNNEEYYDDDYYDNDDDDYYTDDEVGDDTRDHRR